MSHAADTGLSGIIRDGPVIRADAAGVVLLLIGLTLFGVLINPLDPTQASKLVPADAFLVLGAILVIYARVSRDGRLTLRLQPQTVMPLALLAALLGWTMLSGVWGVLRNGLSPAGFAMVTANYVYGGAILTVLVVTVTTRRRLEHMVFAYLIGVACVSAISVLAIFGVGPDWAYHGGGRIKSTSVSVNQLASYVAPAVPLATILCLRAHLGPLGKVGLLSVAVLAMIALMGTGSRTALGLAILSFGLCALGFTLFWRNSLRFSVVLVAGGVVMAIALVRIVMQFLHAGTSTLPVLLQGMARPLDRLSGPGDVAQTLGPRYEQMVIVWQNWFEHPVFGVGPSNFKPFFRHEFEVHNTFLGTLVEVGVPGLALLLLLVGSIILYGFVSTAYATRGDDGVLLFALTAAFFVVCIYGLGSFGLRQRPFWILGGLALAAINLRHVLRVPVTAGPAR